MDKVTIPPEVVEAMAIEGFISESGMPEDIARQWWADGRVPQWTKERHRGKALAAARAMLAAWPGARQAPNISGEGRIILPITQEASNG